MTKRFYGLMSLVTAAMLGTALFLTSEQVQREEKEFLSVQEKVRIEKDSLRILNAEWTYLNRPDRLEQLAATHLNLAPASAQKMIGTIETLPNPFTPAVPGVKPTLVPAGFTALNPAVVSSAPAKTATAAIKPTPVSPKAVPGSTLRFDQLIDRIVDEDTMP